MRSSVQAVRLALKKFNEPRLDLLRRLKLIRQDPKSLAVLKATINLIRQR